MCTPPASRIALCGLPVKLYRNRTHDRYYPFSDQVSSFKHVRCAAGMRTTFCHVFLKHVVYILDMFMPPTPRESTCDQEDTQNLRGRIQVEPSDRSEVLFVLG